MQALKYHGWENSFLKSVRSSGHCVTPNLSPAKRVRRLLLWEEQAAGRLEVPGFPPTPPAGCSASGPLPRPRHLLIAGDLLTQDPPAFSQIAGALSNVVIHSLLPSAALHSDTLCVIYQKLALSSIGADEDPRTSFKSSSLLPPSLTFLETGLLIGRISSLGLVKTLLPLFCVVLFLPRLHTSVLFL